MKERTRMTTLKQFAFIRAYIEEHGYSPSTSEICEYMGNNRATTQYHMDKLFNAGLLESDIEINGARPPRAYRLGNPLKEKR